MLVMKKKDWETPFGEMIIGDEVRVTPYTPTPEEVDKCKAEYFHHLVDGTFHWFKKECGKVVRVHKDSIQSLSHLDSNIEVNCEYVSNGCWKYE